MKHNINNALKLGQLVNHVFEGEQHDSYVVELVSPMVFCNVQMFVGRSRTNGNWYLLAWSLSDCIVDDAFGCVSSNCYSKAVRELKTEVMGQLCGELNMRRLEKVCS